MDLYSPRILRVLTLREPTSLFMTRRIAIAAALAAAVLLTTTAGALAHSQKEKTVPADGAALGEPPAVIAMEFDEPMRITAVSLLDAAGRTIDFADAPGPAPVTRYEATPPELSPGAYVVEWRGLASDGHAMQGRFAFSVK